MAEARLTGILGAKIRLWVLRDLLAFAAMTQPSPPFDAADMQAWFRARADLRSLRAAICDFNGCLRGKRLPVSDASAVVSGGVRMPLTLAAQDIWGRDIAGSDLLAAGDADGIGYPTGRGPFEMPWLDRPTALIPLWLFTEDGGPSPLDPRHALNRVLSRAAAMGLTPVVGTEVEFHLLDPQASRPKPPRMPTAGRRLIADGIHALDELDGFEAFFDDLYGAAEAAGIPAAAAIAEGGPGQFEVTLSHGPDALKAADDAVYLKWLIRGTAQRHGLAATFMAKPYEAAAGNGFHVHASLLDAAGRNVFDDRAPQGAARLGHAVAGALAAMPEMTLVLAPHLNSYRRLRGGAHAPTHANWAHENRFAALRIPGGNAAARRVEYRVAGADANPYLVIAGVIGSLLSGLEAAGAPPPALAPGGAAGQGVALPVRWSEAIEAFRGGVAVARVFDAAFMAMFADAKVQELDRFEARMSAFELRSYLEVV